MVAIKNAVVPPSCCFCPMTNDGFYLCKANNPYKMLEDDCEERRPDWCPLIEVPEPHGRLIDADATISLIDTRGGKVEVTVAHIIEKNRGIVKAVIPASEEEVDKAQRDYERAVEDQKYCEIYEPTYDPDTGAM